MLIQKYLTKHDLTQRVFADQLGCTTAFVNGLINGKNTDIKISLLNKLHKQTKIPMPKLVSELLSYKETTKLKRK